MLYAFYRGDYMRNILLKIILFIYILFILVIISANRDAVFATSGGFGVSGTFASYHYKLVPGERVDTPSVYITFYNNYSKEITVNLFTIGPDGVIIILESDIVVIPAKETLKVLISIYVELHAIPGNHIFGLVAEVVPDEIGGIQIVGSAQLRANLSIYGEAGRFDINLMDSEGNPFIGDLHVFRNESDSLIPVGYSETSAYSDRVIPGNYVVIVYFNGILVAEKKFTVEDAYDKQLSLIAKTVTINTFLVAPNFDPDTNLLLSATIIFGIKNIYLPVANFRVMLNVWYKTKKIDEIEIIYTNHLDVVSFNGRYTYIPSDGWKSGNYSFKLELHSQNEDDSKLNYLLDETSAKTYNVPKDVVNSSINWSMILVTTSSVTLTGFILLVILKNKKRI